jgi:Fe-S-cluster containining protein
MTFDPAPSVSEADFFECKKCGICCKGYGGTFVTKQDIKTIASYINTGPKDFVADFCQMSGNKPLLAQAENDYCIFWEKLCTIHPVKPRMCKAWPFIESILVDSDNWNVMARACPGIKTKVDHNTLKEFVLTQTRHLT